MPRKAAEHNSDSLEGENQLMYDSTVLSFPWLGKASSPAGLHSFEAGGRNMDVKHTHPACTEEERLEQLRAIKKLCSQILCPKEQEERAG